MPSPPLQPRGPLPPRVYWVRRVLVLGLALVLVISLAKLLGGSSDARDSSSEQAVTAGARTTSTPTQPPAEPVKKRKKRKKRKLRATPTEPPLAEPTGPCLSSDIVATPVVPSAEGGRDVAITLNLRTRETPACTWTVSAETLTVSITSGDDFIWASRQCPESIPTQDVVVRQVEDTPVGIVWAEARRSDEDCSDQADWALPGYYHVEAAALGGEPTDVQFELVRPASAVITKTITPKPQPQGKAKDKTPAPGQSETAHTPGEQGGGNSEG